MEFLRRQQCISMTSSYTNFLMAFWLYIFHCWSVCHQTQIENVQKTQHRTTSEAIWFGPSPPYLGVHGSQAIAAIWFWVSRRKCGRGAADLKDDVTRSKCHDRINCYMLLWNFIIITTITAIIGLEHHHWNITTGISWDFRGRWLRSCERTWAWPLPPGALPRPLGRSALPSWSILIPSFRSILWWKQQLGWWKPFCPGKLGNGKRKEWLLQSLQQESCAS